MTTGGTLPGRSLRRGSTWMRPIPGDRYKGLWASAHGDIWSTRSGTWKKLKPRKAGFKKGDERRGGYYCVSFRDHSDEPPKGKLKISCHVLVCLAWYGPKPDPYSTVDHINHDHLDNRPDNLRYLPGRENTRNRRDITDQEWEDILAM